MTFLKPEHMVMLERGVAQLEATKRIALRIEDESIRASVIQKADAQISRMKSEYSEVTLADGTVLVKHPGIGYITVSESLTDAPVRLFGSTVKSLSTVLVTLYRADAHVLQNGNVEYINRAVVIEAEMTQAAFAGLMSNPGRGKFPMTIRKLHGNEVTSVPDIYTRASEIMMERAMNVTDGISEWADKIVALANEKAAKGGVLGGKGREEVKHLSEIMGSWAASNPSHHATLISEHTSQLANEVKLEVISAANLKEAE